MSFALTYQKRIKEYLKKSEKSESNYLHLKNTSPVHHLELLDLRKDLKTLSLLDKHHKFIEKKDTLLPKYQTVCNRYINDRANNASFYQNDALVYCMIWLFDINEFDQALQLAEFAIDDGQMMPSDFKRTIPVFIADTVLDWAKNKLLQNKSIAPYFYQIFKKIYDQQWIIPNVVIAKYYVLLGDHIALKSPKISLHCYDQAMIFDAGHVKRKTQIEKLKKKLSKSSSKKSTPPRQLDLVNFVLAQSKKQFKQDQVVSFLDKAS